MNSDKYSEYSRRHIEEFREELREDASRALNNWPGKSAAVLLAMSSVLTWRALSSAGNEFASSTLLTYSVPILIILLFRPAALLYSRLERMATTVLDLVCLTTLFGFCLTLSYVFRGGLPAEQQMDLFLALSGQINFVILMTTGISYHASFGVTFLRNAIFTLIAAGLIHLVSRTYLQINMIQVVQGFVAGNIFSWIFFKRVQTRFYYKSIDADTRQHLYNQLSKLVYPHQLERIKTGDELESTMPVTKGNAIINVFDVQRSSEIRHDQTKSFFLDVFRSFFQVCMMGYEHNPLKSRAFRLKETGDGFISSVGYPFLADESASLSDNAIATALLMFHEFNREVKKFNYAKPIKGAMGLAFNSVQGTFQSSGIKSYDLYGEALVQAYRYEEIRKHPVIGEIIRQRALSLGLEHYNILIIQEVIFDSLSQHYQNLFTGIDLRQEKLHIRQDVEASFIYFHVLE